MLWSSLEIFGRLVKLASAAKFPTLILLQNDGELGNKLHSVWISVKLFLAVVSPVSKSPAKRDKLSLLLLIVSSWVFIVWVSNEKKKNTHTKSWHFNVLNLKNRLQLFQKFKVFVQTLFTLNKLLVSLVITLEESQLQKIIAGMHWQDMLSLRGSISFT